MLLADETAGELSADEVVITIIFSFLPPVDILRARVCTTWRDAAKKTLVPLTEFVINSVRSYNAMRVMSTVLPKLQQLTISDPGFGHKYIDGEDPDEYWLHLLPTELTTLDIDIISNFSKLRSLTIFDAPLNGRYAILFNFPLLQKLTISGCSDLKWDLEMLEGLPMLKELKCGKIPQLSGSLGSLRVLRDTLETVIIVDCPGVEGNLMDLADFPRLKNLDLRSTTNVRGDIRDIGEHDFPVLGSLFLPKSVCGGIEYEFEHVADVSNFMQAIHLLLQRSPTIFGESDLRLRADTSKLFVEESELLSKAFNWTLSKDSPDWYDWEIGCPPPPFYLQFIQAGSRLGWSWCSSFRRGDHSCEINWLDPEPSSDSSDYEAYIEELRRIDYIEELQRIEGHRNRDRDFYRGYHRPPTEQEYLRLCE
jgi:hypothetical protein